MHVRELFDLAGRTAIVTGGGSGLGRQMAHALAESGANLVLCARKVERCEETARELEPTGVRVLTMACDVRVPEQVQAVVDRAVAELGDIDILVNNAGTSWGAAPEDTPLDGWQKVLDVNVTGAFLFAQSAGRVMIEQERGKVINIASVAAFRGAPAAAMNAIAYNTSKGALVSFTRDLAIKWAPHGINVNAIAPGPIETPLLDGISDEWLDQKRSEMPFGRFGRVEEIAPTAVLLASDGGSFYTGSTLNVSGGDVMY